MKIINVRILLVVALFVVSCKKDPIVAPSAAGESSIIVVGTVLKGSNEVPANTSKAEGSVNGTFNTKTKVLSMTVVFSGMNANNMHIHRAAPGVNGGVIFPIAGPYVNLVTYTSLPLTTAQEDDLMRGMYYVNVHSPTFPGGEIRGQLTK
jgi:CHRD domain